MLKAHTTVSPLSVSWVTWPSASILSSGIASTASIGSVYGVIDQTMSKDDEEEEEDYTPYGDRPETYIVPVVFLLILLIGLTGNGVLALTILRHSNMRNVPNIYVFSLALGDLLARVYCYWYHDSVMSCLSKNEIPFLFYLHSSRLVRYDHRVRQSLKHFSVIVCCAILISPLLRAFMLTES